MKLVTYLAHGSERLGILAADRIIDCATAHAAARSQGNVRLACADMPSEMLGFLRAGEDAMHDARSVMSWFLVADAATQQSVSVPQEGTVLRSPVPHPTSMRDGYAFRQHVEAARRNRGVEMIQSST